MALLSDVIPFFIFFFPGVNYGLRILRVVTTK